MLCTRIRLVERRYSIARETPEGVLKSEATLPGSSSSSLVKTIQRPCVIRNLSRNCGSVISSALTITPRPPTLIDHSLGIKRESRKKPPLVVFSLGIQPGTKTLVQNNIKRDPRKLPTFCKNYKQIITKNTIQKNAISTSELNNEKIRNDDLFVRGVEILSDQQKTYESPVNDEMNDTDSNICCNYIPNELNIQLTDCCQCIRDIYTKRNFENMQIISNSNKDNNNCAELESTMDSTSNFLTIKDLSSAQLNKTGIWINEHYRKPSPSPRTRQVINVTMNNKKN